MILPLDSLRGALWEHPGQPEPRPDGILLEGKTHGKLCTACWDASRGIVVIGDKRGLVYTLYLRQNRFSLAREFPAPVTAVVVFDENLVTAHGTVLAIVDLLSHEIRVELPQSHYRDVFHLENVSPRFFVSVSGDSAIIWDATAEVKISAKIFAKTHFTAAAVLNGEIFLGASDGTISKWNFKTNTNHSIFAASEIGKVSAISSLSCNGEKIIFGLAAQSVAVLVEKSPKIFGFERPALRVSFGAFPGKFDFMALLLDDGIIRFIETSELMEIAKFSRERKAVIDFFICGNNFSICILFSDASFEIADLPDLWRSCRLRERRRLGKPAPEIVEPAPQPRKALKKKQVSAEPSMDEKVCILFEKSNSFGNLQRPRIWQWALECPKNVAAFELLTQRGPHPVFEDFLASETFMHSIRGEQRLLRLLSALAFWQPIFLDAKDFLPKLVFPFVEILGDDPLALFEVVATFLSNFYSRFFDFYPYPPLHVLAMAVETLFSADADLADHLATVAGDDKNSGPPGGIGAMLWPVLQSNFSEILERADWLVLMDYFIAHRGERNISVCALIAWLKLNRAALLKETKFSEIRKFLKTPKPLDFSKFFAEVKKTSLAKPLGALLEPQGEKFPTNFVPLVPGPVYVAAFAVPEFIERSAVTLVRAKVGIVRENLEQHQETLAKLRH